MFLRVRLHRGEKDFFWGGAFRPIVLLEEGIQSVRILSWIRQWALSCSGSTRSFRDCRTFDEFSRHRWRATQLLPAHRRSVGWTRAAAVGLRRRRRRHCNILTLLCSTRPPRSQITPSIYQLPPLHHRHYHHHHQPFIDTTVNTTLTLQQQQPQQRSRHSPTTPFWRCLTSLTASMLTCSVLSFSSLTSLFLSTGWLSPTSRFAPFVDVRRPVVPDVVSHTTDNCWWWGTAAARITRRWGRRHQGPLWRQLWRQHQ